MKKNQMIALGVAAVVVIVGALTIGKDKSGTADKFPERPVTNAVFSSAGGATDQWNRVISAIMERSLNGKINVSNMNGGKGGQAAAWVWDAPHDGYRWLGASETMLTLAVNGANDKTVKDWEVFIIASSPGVICVPGDSPYKTYADLVKAAQDKPNTIKISNSGKGKLWHIKTYISANMGKVPYSYVPYDGSRPAIISTISRETDAVAASAGEVYEFVKSGQLRPLVMMENESFEFPGTGKIPSVTDTFPEAKNYFPLDQWLGFALPADTPKSVLDKVDNAFKEACKAPEVTKLASDTVSKIYGISGKTAKDMLLKSESRLSWLLQEWGLAKESPEKFGIAKP